MLDTLSSILWASSLEPALDKAAAESKLVLLEFSQAPRCAGSVALRARVYTSQPVEAFIVERCVPVSLIRSDRPIEVTRFNIVWTPTVLIVEPDGTERHRIVGFLPEIEFLAQLEMGAAKAAFGREQFAEARRAFARVVERYPQTYAGPEASYWSGVSEYKLDKNREFLKATGARLRAQYPNSEWAAKSAVWLD